MTFQEEIVRLVLDSVYTSLPCKVEEYDNNTRFAKCSLMTKTKKEGETPLVRVPILRLVGGSVPLKVGMIIPVFFSKYAINDFILNLTKSTVKNSIECLQFQRSSAYGLPFVFDEKLNISIPEFVEFDTRVIFKETVLMEKEVECLKSVSMKSTLSVDGATDLKATTTIQGETTINNNLIVSGTVASTGNMSSPNLNNLKQSYDNHKHLDAEGRPTTTPN